MAKNSIKQRLNTLGNRNDANALLPILSGLPIVQVLTGSATYDAASVASGASTTTTVAVTGAALGDYVPLVSLGVSQAGLAANAYVSAANTVTVVLVNNTGGAVDLASTTLRVGVIPFGSLVSSNTNQIIP